MKALSAVIIVSTALAAPVFGQEAIGSGYELLPQLVTNYRSNYQPYDRNFNELDNQVGASFNAPLTGEERQNLEDFGFSGRDPSRVGGESPYLHPGG